MKSYVYLVLLLVLFCSTVVAQQSVDRGILKEKQSVKSNLLGEVVNYSIYLPAGYEAGNRSYPVTYVLHGYTDDETAWVQFGEIDRQADEAIQNGEISPMILVMPDAKVTWYVNDINGKNPYEYFFVKELIPHIEANYRVRAKRTYRGITGLSMGGYGSFLYAIKYPELFAAAAPLSAAIYTEKTVKSHDQSRWDQVEGPMYGVGLTGSDRITSHWKANNPFYILENTDLNELKKVRFWFDCGDDDFLYEGNAMMHIALRDAEIKHEFRIRDGEHNWTYWREGIIPALKFISKSYRK